MPIRRASNNNNKYPTVHQVKWTSSRSSRLLFDASTSIFQVDDRFSRQPDVQDGDIARFDSVTNTATLALGTYSNNPMFRGVFIGSVSYFTTTHDIKAGYSMNYAKRTGNVYSTQACARFTAAAFPTSSTRTTRRSARSRRIASRACTSRTSGARRAS